MSENLKSSAKRVQEFLTENGFDFLVKELPSSTRTAVEAAASIGCTVPQIAKSLIFKDSTSGNPVLVVASGSNRVSTSKIESQTGLHLEKADALFVKEKVGYAIGGVPPVAHNQNVRTILDPDLKQFEVIWAAAGTPNAVFKLKSSDLESLTKGTWIELAQ